MATRLVTLKLSGGREVKAEVEEIPGEGPTKVSLSGPGAIDFRAALNDLTASADDLLHSIEQIAQPPDSVELSFGVKLSAAAGVVLAKASGEANFTVKMSWSGRRKSSP